MNPREAAYLAIWRFFKDGHFASETLLEWRTCHKPAPRDFRLAQEMSYGTIRMSMALDFLIKQLSAQKKLPAKLKEKILLRLALYQFYFMDQVPLYAIADESIKIAQRYCHASFTSYLNAILRTVVKVPLQLPKGNAPEELSIRHSYPIFFVNALVEEYGRDVAESILKLGNQSPTTMARQRKTPFEMVTVAAEEIERIAQDSHFYIQNATPVRLIANLCEQGDVPGRILDLCASPGGKLIALHDYFPQADLHANDVQEEKVVRLQKNLSKYQINAHLSCCRGEDYPAEQQFDLIVLDVPCSNSGVLNKRPEARWRLSAEAMAGLEKTQFGLLRKACTLLLPAGEIWYMTCSILKAENERLVRRASFDLGMKIKYQQTILPNADGWDGGFAAILYKA